jgi:MFS family permease
MDNQQVSPRHIWALVLEKGFFFFGLAFAGPATVLTALASQLTSSSVLIGSINMVWNGGAILPVPFVARWIRNHSERMPIIRGAELVRAGAFGIMVLWLVFTRAQNPGLTLIVLMLSILLFCGADGFNSVPYVDMIARVLTSRERSRMTWQGMLLGGFLSIIGSVIVQRVLTPGTLSYPMNYTVLLGVATFLFFMALLVISTIPERIVQVKRAHQVEGSELQAPRALGSILRSDAIYRRMLLTRFLTSLDQMSVSFYTVFALSQLKMSTESVGIFVAAQSVGALIAPMAYGRISERYGAQRVIQVSAFIQVLAPAVGFIVALLGTANPALAPLIVLAFVVSGMGNSSMAIGYYIYPLDWCPANDRPNYIALLSTVGIMSMIAPLLGGVLVQVLSYQALFCITAVLVSIGTVVSLTLPDRRHA